MVDFEDGKDDGALRTIGEVSEALGIRSHVLRYWEQQFALLKPLKRSGGRRYYRPSDVELVEQINRLVNQEGYTLKGAEAVLRAKTKSGFTRRTEDRQDAGASASSSSGPAAAPTPAKSSAKRELSDTINQLKNLRSRLATALDA